MNGWTDNHWLLLAALGYWLLVFNSAFLAATARITVALVPMSILLTILPAIAVSAMIVARTGGFRFHWAAMTGYVVSVLLTEHVLLTMLIQGIRSI